jgi:hypothetical protein
LTSGGTARGHSERVRIGAAIEGSTRASFLLLNADIEMQAMACPSDEAGCG